MADSPAFDWVVLFLRLLFIALLYFFLFQIVRVTTRELIALASTAGEGRPARRGVALIVLDPAESDLTPGLRLPVGLRTLVGRHPSCDLVIDEPFVSAEHAEIAASGGRWRVRDLGSTNGTFLNGEPVVLADMEPGDVVQFGRVTLQFEA